eukprot:UN02899
MLYKNYCSSITSKSTSPLLQLYMQTKIVEFKTKNMSRTKIKKDSVLSIFFLKFINLDVKFLSVNNFPLHTHKETTIMISE